MADGFPSPPAAVDPFYLTIQRFPRRTISHTGLRSCHSLLLGARGQARSPVLAVTMLFLVVCVACANHPVKVCMRSSADACTVGACEAMDACVPSDADGGTFEAGHEAGMLDAGHDAPSTPDAGVDAAAGGAVISTIDLTSLDGTDGLKLNGIRGSAAPLFGDLLGSQVAGIGDVNDDGKADLLIAAKNGEDPSEIQPSNDGAVFVLYGDTRAHLNAIANGTRGFDLSLLDGTQGIAIYGPSGNAELGRTIGGGGDYDNDGISDLLIGERNFGGGNSRGYVVYGDDAANGSSGSDFGDLDTMHVSSLAGAVDINGDGLDDGAEFDGLASTTYPTSINHGGDIDGDGIDDLLVGNPDRDANGSDSGETFLVFGNSSRGAIDSLNALGDAHGTAVLSFAGNGANDFSGRTVIGIGDINNDGFGDFAIAASSDRTDGVVYVVFGDTRAGLAALSSRINATGMQAVLDGTNGFVLDNPPFASFGSASVGADIAGIDDFNGDMIDDFAIVEAGFGVALVIFGKTTPFGATIDLTSVMNTANGGFALAGGIEQIDGAGDVNGDGLSDLIMGSQASNDAYIIFGTADPASLLSTVAVFGTDMVDLTDGSSSEGGGVQLSTGGILFGKGVLLDGAPFSSTGSGVAGLGDVNGDGFADVAIGAQRSTAPTASGNPAGQAFIVYGRDFSAG